MAYFSCSLQPKFVSSPSSSTSLKPRLQGLKKYYTNVLPNFACNKGSHLANPTGSIYRFVAKCSKQDDDVKPVEQQPRTEWTKVDVDIKGLDPTVLLTPLNDLKRGDFKKDFMFGASTSALQTEGSGIEGGRGESTWDHMIKASMGMKGANSYNMYEEDIKLLKAMGMNAYRFSISWPRILPKGTGDINEEGIKFYNDLITKLKANEITPVVTLFHFDLPVNLQTEYNGFLSGQIVEDFKNFARICFENFGDRVKHWSTINEPFVYGSFAYRSDPYKATHNIILAHATAAKLYHDDYQKRQGGQIGISLPCKWFEPHTDTSPDKTAAKKHLDFMLGWYMDPFIKGEYPESMKESIRGLPEFIPEQKKMLQESCDFIGINYYTGTYSKQKCTVEPDKGVITIQYLEDTKSPEGKLIGVQAEGQEGIYVHPDGLRKLLIHIKERYKEKSLEIYVTENGVPSKPKITRSVIDSIAQKNISELEAAFSDDYRISHAEEHLIAVRDANEEGVNVKGYFVWTLMDNMEVGAGYETRFGLNYVDYCDNYKRYPKKSAKWFAEFLKKDAPKGLESGN